MLLKYSFFFHGGVFSEHRPVVTCSSYSSFNAEMRNRVDEILFVGKLSAINIPAPDDCCIAEASAETDM